MPKGVYPRKKENAAEEPAAESVAEESKNPNFDGFNSCFKCGKGFEHFPRLVPFITDKGKFCSRDCEAEY